MELDLLVEKAKTSQLFTSPVLEKDLARFFEEHGDQIRKLAHDALETGIKHIYWIGSGNSWTNLYSGKYLLDRFTNLTSDCYNSYESIWRASERLGEGALGFFASYSGATEDTLAALRFAKSRGVRTVALVNKANSLMGSEADEVIAYNSTALYILPLAAAYLFSLEVARLQGKPVEKTIEALYNVPSALGRLYRDEEMRARQLALEYKDNDLFYILASGPLYGLGYKFALTVFMENMRVHASFMETSEFRHGPVEMLDRQKATLVFLVGTDESREMSERVIATAKDNGANVIVYDYADSGLDDPLLAPFGLMVPLQWFAVHSSFQRGIADLDERVVMGRRALARGEGVTWP